MYRMVSMVNNTVLYLKFAEWLVLKVFSPHRQNGNSLRRRKW